MSLSWPRLQEVRGPLVRRMVRHRDPVKGPGGLNRRGGVVRKFRGNPWAVLLVVSLGFFMTLLDKTITGANN